ncbi:outer membrane transport energization protein ExbB [Litorimonas taeanensis]|uniref:Outer membrane transport energization protein ExbB n=1 Tax=Litorimonas taeanensis TaxID=568099 RepID=A0A420WIR3_9PROT|nr:MotA/TolQ/ExbB proton channel family protein [Litorimonas taeanensis]RKQ70877.1 outer membrane transport energization protein ExbB [Litorimonas taeanensis]
MKFLTKATAAVIGSAVMLSALPASGQISSVNELLSKVRQDAAKVEQENRQREAEFRQRRDQQQALLAKARADLGALERQAASVERTFAANRNTIDGLKGELRAAQGDFGEVFGLARSKAGEFKALLDSSLITAEYPNRTEVLGRVAESEALPSSEDLNAIYERMLQEIREQRLVKEFQAPVANVDDGAVQSVTRVGPFAVFTSGSANFLGYSAPTGESASAPLLKQLPKQPGGQISAAASDVTKAGSGDLVYAPIDPTRGALLESFERVPDVKERISYGGTIGYIILLLLLIGGLFGLLNIVRLFLIKTAVSGQKRKAQGSKSNPLGRVMLAYEGAKSKDADTVELKLDEAILKESPKLEVGLNLLKLFAGIAPLLGLLGTVTGMIKTFQAMMIYGTGDPQLMAGGISEALVTTMLGLIAAIPLLILHSFCSSLARSVQGTLEEQSAGIVARHVESRTGV